MKKKKMGRLLAFLLAVVMVFALPVEASAATKKVTAMPFENADQLSGYKSAPTVKIGRNQIICQTERVGGDALVKFTASKTKTYNFTVKNLRNLGRPSRGSKLSGGVYFFEGFSDDGALIVDAQSEALVSVGFKRKFSVGVTSKTFKIALKKGQTIYVAEWSDQTRKRGYDLIIK